MKNIERLEFDGVEKYLSYLKHIFDELQASGFYNIYLHQIGRLDDFDLQGGRDYQQVYEQKIKSFLEKGLRIDRYGSIGGTAKFMGQCGNVALTDVLNYSFDKYVPHNAVAIFALPKYIRCGGKVEEFSSFRGRGLESPILKNSLHVLYKSAGLRLQERDFKFCLYDAVKGEYLPNIFLLGIQEIDRQSGKISFVEAGTHLSKLQGEERQSADEVLRELGGKIAQLLSDGSSTREVLLERAKIEENSKMYDLDFDI